LISVIEFIAVLKNYLPETQYDIARSIYYGKFGRNKKVLITLLDNLPKMEIQDKKALQFFVQAIHDRKFGEDKKVLTHLVHCIERMDYIENEDIKRGITQAFYDGKLSYRPQIVISLVNNREMFPLPSQFKK
jgi:hypothetical protein